MGKRIWLEASQEGRLVDNAGFRINSRFPSAFRNQGHVPWGTGHHTCGVRDHGPHVVLFTFHAVKVR